METVALTDAQHDRLCRFLDSLLTDSEFQAFQQQQKDILQTLEGRLDPEAKFLLTRLRSSSDQALTWHIFKIAQWTAQNL